MTSRGKHYDFLVIFALSLTPCFSVSLVVFDDAINKISQLAGMYLPLTHTHFISLMCIHIKSSTKCHPLPTEGINCRWSKYNTAQSHHSDRRFSRSTTRLLHLCFKIPLLHAHTYQHVTEVVLLEALCHHAIMWWNHFKIPLRCHSDSVEEHLTPILRDSHLTALQQLLQQWLQRRRGFITVIMGNHGDVTRWMTHSAHWCTRAKSQTATLQYEPPFWWMSLNALTAEVFRWTQHTHCLHSNIGTRLH